MINIFLIVVLVIIAILTFIGITILVIVFGHPDDKNAAYLPKVVTVFGLWLAFASLLVLPYDVAASSIGQNALGVNILWQIIYIILAVMIAVIVPFSFFYYESDVDDTGDLTFFDTQIGAAIKYTLLTAVVLIVGLFIMYSYLNTVTIPVTRMAVTSAYVTSTLQPFSSIPDFTLAQSRCPLQSCIIDDFSWKFPASLPLYVIAFVAFVGWFFFVMFVGVGFVAFPLDLINDYRFRPTPISAKVFFEQRAELGRRAQQLIKLGEDLQVNMDRAELKRKQRGENKNNLAMFEKQYFFFKKDYQVLMISHKLKGGNPLFYIGKLLLGIIGLGLSLAWIIQILIFMIPAKPINPFLNTFFITLTNAIPGFPLFGVVAFAIFSFYLLVAVVAGNFKLGVRFLFFKLYPMEVGNTLMNAFLFNTWIILFTTAPAAQFCVDAFPYYTAQTQASIMFGNQVQYLDFFSYFFQYNIFIFCIIAIFGLTVIFSIFFPNNKAKKVDAILDKVAKSKSTSLDFLDIGISTRGI